MPKDLSADGEEMYETMRQGEGRLGKDAGFPFQQGWELDPGLQFSEGYGQDADFSFRREVTESAVYWVSIQ